MTLVLRCNQTRAVFPTSVVHYLIAVARHLLRAYGGIMNRDQVKGAAKDIAGKAQQKVGEVTGSASQQVKGGAKQVEGKLQKTAGDIREAAEKANKGRV